MNVQRLIRFVCVGGIGAVCYVGLANLAVLWGAPISVASLVAYCLCIYPMYRLHQMVVFDVESRHPCMLPKYVITQLLSLVIAAVAPMLMNDLAMPLLLIFVLTNLMTAVVSYLMQLNWVFSVKHSPTGLK